MTSPWKQHDINAKSRCSLEVGGEMLDPYERVVPRFIVCIMRHPCLFGFIFGFCTVMLWWTCSRVTLATRNFPINQMQIFPVGSYVQDIYDGSLDLLGNILKTTDLRFVVYYAPWCAQSRKIVPEMGHAAKILSQTVDFIAINCWVGSCKQNFSLHEFPKFFAYHTNYPPVEFLEPPEAWRIVNFLQSIQRPFHYIGNEQKLQEILSSNQAVIIGYFNMDSQSNKRFHVFLELCVASVSKDSKTLFGIVTNSRVATLVGFEKKGQIVLHQILGQRNFFPSNLNFTVETIFSWISKHHIEFVTKLSPSMATMDQHIAHLKRGPALLLFLSQKGGSSKRSLEVLREYRRLAAVYHNCSAESFLPAALSSSFNNSRPYRRNNPETCISLFRQYSKHLCDICQYSLADCGPRKQRLASFEPFWNLPVHIEDMSIRTNSCRCLRRHYLSICEYSSLCCVEIGDSKGNSASDFLEKVQLESKERKDAIARDLKSVNDSFNSKVALNEGLDTLVDAFKTLLDVVSESNDEIMAKLQGNSFFSRKLLHKNFEEAIKAGQQELRRLRAKMKSNEEERKNRFSDIVSTRNFSFSDFNGLRCKTNRTVNFFYLDIDRHEKMVRDLGIFEELRPRMVLTLVDVKNEATFVFNKSFTLSYNNVVNFITNYTNGKLKRILRSSGDTRDCVGVGACIHEVTTNSFDDIVLDDSVDVFLMYYAPWCGFCKHAAKSFLQLARLFKGINTLRFARIDADKNDLPYHYAVDGFPTFILFPIGRKSYSRTYPDSEPIRVNEMKDFLTNYTSYKTRSSLESFLRNVT